VSDDANVDLLQLLHYCSHSIYPSTTMHWWPVRCKLRDKKQTEIALNDKENYITASLHPHAKPSLITLDGVSVCPLNIG